MPASPAVEAFVARWVAKLDHAYDRVERCSVVVELPHRRHRHGKQFRVTLQLRVPGTTLSITDEAHEDIYVAIAEAFRTARRRLQDYARIQRGDIKLHARSACNRASRAERRLL